jgi:hypothetical protein
MNMYEKSFADIFTYLAKRAVMLIAKLLGFKTFCLMLTTVLLKYHIVSESVWQSVMITVICAAGGVRLADVYSCAAAARRAGSRTGTQFKPEGEENYEEETETHDTAADSPVPCSRTYNAAAGIQRAAGKGKERIRALLASGCTETADGERTAGSGNSTGQYRPDAAGNAGTAGAD